jgi:hypothetical protein
MFVVKDSEARILKRFHQDIRAQPAASANGSPLGFLESRSFVISREEETECCLLGIVQLSHADLL